MWLWVSQDDQYSINCAIQRKITRLVHLTTLTATIWRTPRCQDAPVLSMLACTKICFNKCTTTHRNLNNRSSHYSTSLYLDLKDRLDISKGAPWSCHKLYIFFMHLTFDNSILIRTNFSFAKRLLDLSAVPTLLVEESLRTLMNSLRTNLWSFTEGRSSKKRRRSTHCSAPFNQATPKQVWVFTNNRNESEPTYTQLT